MQATDPRWVLALRTGEALEGPLLRPEKRQSLLRLGRVMGLRAFDCNLIFAIVQDQARRGFEPRVCAREGVKHLELIPLPDQRTPRQRWLSVAVATASFLMLELLVVWRWLG